MCTEGGQNFDFALHVVQKSMNICICKWKKKKRESSPCACLAQSTFQRVPSKKRQFMVNRPFGMSQRARIHHRYITSTQAGENIPSLLSFSWSAKTAGEAPLFMHTLFPCFPIFHHGTALYSQNICAGAPARSGMISRIPSSLNNLGNAFASLISSPLPNLTAHSLPRPLATPPLPLPSAANVPTPLRHTVRWRLAIEH